MRRCLDPNNNAYKNYGRRGIAICKGWQSPRGVRSFIEDMGETRKPGTTLDRIDNDGGYWCGHCEECLENGWPANCRWLNRTKQNVNARRKKNKTGFTGVYLNNGKYSTEIRAYGKKKRLGTYETPEEASRVYEAAKIRRDYLLEIFDEPFDITELGCYFDG